MDTPERKIRTVLERLHMHTGDKRM